MFRMEEDPDIDIDENPIMYPRIENIFSDVQIKAEPEYIDVDEYDSIEIEEYTNDYYMPFPNKIILGSKPSTLIQSEPTPGPSCAPDDWPEEDNTFECVECNLLFPTQNELDSHNTTSHSFLVARPMSRAIRTERRLSVSSASSRSFSEGSSAQEDTVRRQKAVKSTAKSSLNKTFPILHNALKNASFGNVAAASGSQMNDADDMGDRLLCKHCDVRFSNEIALIKHTYELLPESKFQCDICNISFESTHALRGHMRIHTTDADSPKSTETLLQCLYCTCYLMYPGFMKKHLFNNHKVTEFAVRHTEFSGNCAFCLKSINNYKKYNNHVVKYHRKMISSKTLHRFNSDPVKMKCRLCSQIFMSRYTAYKHKAEKHPEHSQKHTFHVIYDKPVKQLPEIPQGLRLNAQPPKTLLRNKAYIPKQNLFKCNKCQIHFVSCSAAFAHSKRCSLAKGDWKCNKCRRTFTKAEKSLHTQQHQFSEKFKVHIVCDKILSKVLCRCPKCELLFDEIAFNDHASAVCVRENGMECKSCDLKIHSDSYAKHRRYHNKYNFASGDFVVVDFVDVSGESAPVQKESKRCFKQKLMYCKNCMCHFYKFMPKHKYHLEKSCGTFYRRCCTICGLTFSRKPYISHMKFDHETNNYKLDDFKFVRIQDLAVTNPMMPEFYQCQKCEVRFVSQRDLNSHSCGDQVFVKCSKCTQKYDDATYKIHLTFHNYGRSETEDEGVSVLLKFYCCVTCNYGFHSYDSLVEHCQNHYNNSEKLGTRHCKMCKLNYADNHKPFHSNRPKFEILRFDYEKLFTDDWLAGFGSVPTDVVQNILFRSVYGSIRNVRLELLIEGPAQRTLFKCAQCQINFDQDYVVDHATEDCSSRPRFQCTSCTAVFNTKAAEYKHMNVHVVYGDDIIFREIIFKYENDKELNEALITGRRKESLKFRKCQQCEFLIKASDYEAHIASHDKKVEIKHYSFRRTNKVITYKLEKPVNGGKKLYTVYKCKLCNACIMRKVNMIRHKCGVMERYEKCSKCSLYFLSWNLKRHVVQHSTIPKFNSKNIMILEFELLDKSKSGAKKRRRYSSDDDASASKVTVEVSKKYDTRKVTGRPYSANLGEDSQDNISDDTTLKRSSTSNAYAKKYIKKSCISKIDREEENDDPPNKIQHSPVKKQNLSESSLDVEKWCIDMKNKLYRCEKCFLCFPYRHVLLSHLGECVNNTLEPPLECNRCHLVFHPSMTSFHVKLHEMVRQRSIENYYYLIHISTNGVTTNNELQWLYKCKICNVHYLSGKAMQGHYKSYHKVRDLVVCEHCGLQFTKKSRSRHMRIQHVEGSWSRNDLHMEISERKKVDKGEFQLTAFVNTQSPEKDNMEIEKLGNHAELPAEVTIDSIDSSGHFNETSKVSSPKILNDETEDDNNSDVSKEEQEVIDHNLYKCDICPQHYLSRSQLVRHKSQAVNHKAKSLRCDLCNLLFAKRTLILHISKQHNELKLKGEDLVINLQINPNSIKENSGVLPPVPIGDTSIEATLSGRKKKNGSMSEKYKDIMRKCKTDVSGPIDNHLYKCVECSIYYTNRNTLLLHIVIKKHKLTESATCDICGLLFGKGSLTKHKKVQHEELNLTRKDFIVCDVFRSQLRDDDNNDQSITNAASINTVELPLKELDDDNNDQSVITNASLINTDDLPMKELEDKELHPEHPHKEILEDNPTKVENLKIFTLYQCKDCKVCVQKTGRKLHVCCSDIQKKQCIQCCLSFRYTDVIQHQRLHRKYGHLSRKNFVLIRFGYRTDRNHAIYKCVSCSTHFVSMNALEWHMKTRNHQTKIDYCNKCGLFFGRYSLSRHDYIHHKKLNLAVEEFNIIYVDENPPNKETTNINTALSEPETASNVQTVKKLFKCVECDIHFLTRSSYYQHIYKHKKLDATEYIDCNICDFQFLIDSLGMHMKSHKDKSFSLDKLLIEEYHPNRDSHKVQVYFVKDNLNSKLVSTTTPFDNDDENVLNSTDEQLSVIDSTSDGISQSRAEEIIDVDANSHTHDSGSCTEECILNPMIDLPADVSVTISD